MLSGNDVHVFLRRSNDFMISEFIASVTALEQNFQKGTRRTPEWLLLIVGQLHIARSLTAGFLPD